jgi:AcrR family transcriptional regulator
MAKTPSKKTDGRPTAQPLSRERIVSAALALVAEETLAGFSTRKLGERLGCEAMSIYHHFPSKQHLMDALVEYAISSVQMPGVELPPVERLRAAMYAYRDMAHRFPALFPLVAVHRLNMPAGVRFIESILEIVRAVVPDRELAARQFRVIGLHRRNIRLCQGTVGGGAGQQRVHRRALPQSHRQRRVLPGRPLGQDL